MAVVEDVSVSSSINASMSKYAVTNGVINIKNESKKGEERADNKNAFYLFY